LKRRGISWTKFIELNELTKRNFPTPIDGSEVMIDLGDGWTASATWKDITEHQGKARIIGREVSHISIKQIKES
jgi:hypothetical protein